MARVGPGLTTLVAIVAACGATAACASRTESAEPAKPPSGWYSSGTRSAADSTRSDDAVSRPVRDDDRVATPIVPYASTLFGSSRTDLPNVPAPLPAQAEYGAPQPWNAATPPVVDLGRDFGITPPQAADQATQSPPMKAVPAYPPASGRPAEVRPPVTQDASPRSVVPAGPLVPVTLPSATAPQNEVEPSVTARPQEQPSAPKAMTPVKPPRGETAKNAATKPAPTNKAALKPKSTPQGRLETPGAIAPKSVAPKDAKPTSPARFLLPQPAIPLESRLPHLLRKVLGS